MVFDIDQFVADCRQAAGQPDAEDQILKLMQATVASPERVSQGLAPLSELSSALSGEPAEPEMGGPRGEFELGYDRIFFEDDSVTIFGVDTTPGCLQPPHDHQMTAVIGVFEGVERNRFFKPCTKQQAAGQAGGQEHCLIEMYGETAVGPGDVVVIKPDMIHAISAANGKPCRALHVYLGSLSTVNRSLFDPLTGEPGPMTSTRYADFCLPDSLA